VITTVRVLGLRAGDFGTVATAARRVVGYVQGTTGRRRTATRPAGAAGYFTEGLARGRARGGGAGLVGLRGEVEPLHLERLLTGGHARTGLALLGARGSAGRASAGTPPPPGRPDDLLGLAEAARIAGVDVAYLRRLARRTAHPDPDPDPAGLPREDRLAALKDPDSGRWTVRRDELDRFLRDRERPTVVMGFDVTCAVPKSVSLLWAFGDDDLRADVAAALNAGVDAVIAYLDRHAAVGTLDGHNRPGLGLAAASYLHEVARSDEAHLHVHTIVANAVAVPLLDDDGHPVRDDQGGARVQWRALDSEVFLAHVQTAGFLGAAALRHELSRRRGLSWAPVRNGVAELAAFPRPLLEAFSTRAGQVAEEFAQLVAAGFEPGPGTRAAAQRASRPPKKIWADAVIRRIQHDRLTAAGWTPGQVRALGTPAARDLPRPGPTDTAQLADDLTGPGGLTARSTTFGRQDILRAVAGWAGDRLDAPGVVAVGERLAADPRIVLVDQVAVRRRHDPEPVFTTVNLLEAEDSVLALCRQGRVAHGGPPRHLLPPDILEDVLAERLPDIRPGAPLPTGTGTDRPDQAPAATPGESRPAGGPAPSSGAPAGAGALPALSDDQRRAVRAVLASPDLVRPVIGPAGSGKTEAMRHVTAVLTGAGYRIVGAAHGGRQAEHLTTRLNVESRVVASWLTLLDHAADPALIWPPGTVLVVDEATQVDTRDAERLLRYATRTGTVVIALGDPAQLPAVGAGGWFTHLVAATPDVPSLTTAHRQTGPGMAEVRAALAGLRDDTGAQARGALRRLAADGRIRLFDDRDALLAAVVADWYTEQRPHHPASSNADSGGGDADRDGPAGGGPAGGTTMLAETHHDVDLLNQAARGCLRADGTLTGPALHVGGRQFQVGDQVITLTQHGHTLVPAGKPASAFIRTGTPGHVTAVHLDPDHPGRQALTVTFPTKGAVHVGWDYLTHTFPDGRDGGLAHAYAITAHKAQGATLSTARAVVPDTTSRPGLYVMLSRARADLAAYVIRRGDLDADPDDENWLPVLRDSHGPLDRLADRLARSRAERMASDHDPYAAAAHALATRHTLAELAVLRRATTRAAHPPDLPDLRRLPDRRGRSDAPPPLSRAGQPDASGAASARPVGAPAPATGMELPVIRRAERAAEATVATRALTDPPAALVSRIGPRPGAGPTRTVWDQAVTALAIYHARYEPPTPAHDPGPSPDPGSPDATYAARWHEQRGQAERTARTWARRLPPSAAARFTSTGDRVARDRAIAGIHALLEAGWHPRRLLDALATHDEQTVRSAAAILDHRVAALTAAARMDAADYTDPPPPGPAEHWRQTVGLLTAAEINDAARRQTGDLTAESADLRRALTAAARAAAARQLATDTMPVDIAAAWAADQEQARRRLRRATTDLAASLLLRDAANTRLRLRVPGRSGSRQGTEHDEAVRAGADADQRVRDGEQAADVARALDTAVTPESPPGDVDAAGDYLEHRLAVVTAALDRQVDDACLHATTEPAAYLTGLLGTRPTEPAHATRWDSRVRAVEHHRHHTLGLPYDTPAAPRDAPPTHRALGPPPDDPDRRRDYHAMLEDQPPQPQAEPGL
jgi:TrwC relaxase/AAA domain